MSEALVNMNAESEVTTEAPDSGVEQQHADAQQEGGEQEEKLFAGKYKTPEDLEKGYKELSKKVRENKVEVPDEYNLEKLEGVFEADDPMLTKYLGKFKELGLSQDQAEHILAEYGADMIGQKIDPEAELAKLGNEGKSIIGEIESFVAKQGSNFSDSEKQILASMTSTAEGVRAFHKLVSMTKTQNIPSDVDSLPAESKAELQEQASKLRQDPNFFSKPDLQQKYNELMRRSVQ